MKLAFASSLSHDVLKRYFFLGTLCDPWELVELRFQGANGNYGTAEYNRVVLDRIAMSLDLVRRHPGEIIVFSDVDIQWFRPAQPALERALEGHDVVFQRELPTKNMANCGFIAVQCNGRSAAFFALLADAARGGNHDQATTNSLIAEGGMPCRYGFLPPTFFNDNLNGRSRPLNSELILYHSIGTLPGNGQTSIQMKLERHLSMRASVLGSSDIFQALDGAAHLRPSKPLKCPTRLMKAPTSIPQMTNT